MVRYGGFFFLNILIHETITKVKGGSVCVWDGGGGGEVIVQVFIHKSRTYQMLTV